MVNILVSVRLSQGMESNFETRVPVDWVLLFSVIGTI
jgi:hypothetical protein